MSEQDDIMKDVLQLQRSALETTIALLEDWKQRGQPWRSEPEIDIERQKYLEERRSIKPHLSIGICPFNGIKLSRADVEWLLATHENGRGPINWGDESQRNRIGLDLRGADLRGVSLSGLPLAGLQGELNIAMPFVAGVILQDANLYQTHLEGAKLSFAHLEGVKLIFAHLEDANLYQTHLEGAKLSFAHLEGANLYQTHLEGADLSSAFFDSETKLGDIHLTDEKYGSASFADIHWGDVNVAVVDWTTISEIGDELGARQQLEQERAYIDERMRFRGYPTALRAYRQLAVVLRNQGLNEDANRFAYRAQLMQRKVSWYRRRFWCYLGSLFLALLAGYGYKPWRSFVAYLIVITAFATAYFIVDRTVGPTFSPLSAWVFSMTSFHGRGFFPGGIKLDDPLTVVAAFEAFIGLLIEVTFIATLTRRLFGG